MIRNNSCVKFSFSFFLFLIFQFEAFSQHPSFNINELLKSVKPEQPRIVYSFELQAKLDSMILKDTIANKDLKKLTVLAQQMLDRPVVDFSTSLDTGAQEFYKRIITLSFAARHTGRKEFFQKMRKEMEQATSLQSWQPQNFTTLSLMTLSVALGYDWLNTSLDGETKKKYNEAIYSKGLKYGLVEYEKVKPGQKIQEGDWINSATSSSVINNCGMLLGALSIARDFPQASANTIFYASNSLSGALRNFPLSIVQEIKKSDEINLFLTVSALKFALNRDFGISNSLGYKLINQSFKESSSDDLSEQQLFVYKYLLGAK
jgi:hypothetical protein